MRPILRSLRIFLCHSSGDKPAVRELYVQLCTDEFSPWLDEENLEAGQEWEQEIPTAVRNSDVVIVCLSNDSINKRGYVQKEIRLALDVADEQPEGSIFLIPLKLEDCEVPERLRRWHWVNLFEKQGYARLLRALRLCSKRMGVTEQSSSGGEGIFSGIEQVITVLFAKTLGYVTAFESTPPAQVVQLLDELHSTVFRVITDYGGVLNQYLGGGLMALFGVPAATSKDSLNALRAAVAMQRQIWRINEERRLNHLSEIRIGIGLHTGIAVVGLNGSEIGSEYTVIGDPVNLAGRLQSFSEAWQIIISGETAEAAEGIQWPLRPLQPFMATGRVNPVSLFEVDWRYDK